MDFVEGRDLPRYLEGFFVLLSELAKQAAEHGDRAVELAARDAADHALVLLDVLVMPAVD